MEWWHWIVIGVFCLLIEVATPGSFVFAFFATGTVAAGVLQRLGVAPEFWQQSIAVVLIAVGSLLLFRRRLMRLIAPRGNYAVVDDVAGETVLVTHEIAALASGRVEFRGTVWTAHNTSAISLAAGTRCTIVGMDGIALRIAAPSEGVS